MLLLSLFISPYHSISPAMSPLALDYFEHSFHSYLSSSLMISMWEPTLNCSLFSQKSSVMDVWYGLKYASAWPITKVFLMLWLESAIPKCSTEWLLWKVSKKSQQMACDWATSFSFVKKKNIFLKQLFLSYSF